MSPVLLAIFAVLARILLNPLANVFQKQLIAEGNAPLIINFIIHIILSVACVFVGLNVEWDKLPLDFWKYSVYVGILGALGNWFFIKALEGGDLSVLGPMNAYKSVIGLIGGIIILQEMPNLFGYLGILLVTYGSYIILDTPGGKLSASVLLKRKDIQYRIWGMVLGAVEAVFIKKVILNSSTKISFISYCWFGALFTFVLILINRTARNSYSSDALRGSLKKFFYVAVCLGIVQLGTNCALREMPVGYVLSLFQLSAIVSVLLGHKIFKEQGVGKKLIGAFFMLLGAVVIILKG